LEARSLSVPLVRPNRYCLTLTPELKLRISRKNVLRRIAQSTKNAVPKLKVSGVTLMTEQEKAIAIAEKFFRALENTVQFH
jgi:hypothetical protein